MIEINCEGCENNCCGKIPWLTPVLLPIEFDRFENYSRIVDTPKGKMKIIKKKKNGTCIFLDEKTKRCTHYQDRPLECQLYPFLLDFTKKQVDVKLDNRFCKNLTTLEFDIKKIRSFIRTFDFPQSWIEAYETMDEY
jgi:Fe-S-cluster containining protein